MNASSNQRSLPMPLRVAGALLVAWILVLSFAGVSPQLHSWLHQESGCAHTCESHPDEAPDETAPHYCGVVALQGALNDLPIVCVPERLVVLRAGHEWTHDDSALSSARQTHRARAPPLKS